MSTSANDEPPRGSEGPRQRRETPGVPEILLVEDNYINQMVAIAHLNRFGFAVHTVNNGREALDAVLTREYDIILMDCQMPEMDGYEATRAIRALDNLTRRTIPIIAMTANAMHGHRETCLAAGMDDFLTKPFRPEQLNSIIHFWLNKPR